MEDIWILKFWIVEQPIIWAKFLNANKSYHKYKNKVFNVEFGNMFGLVNEIKKNMGVIIVAARLNNTQM